jgi:hypothetical protein
MNLSKPIQIFRAGRHTDMSGRALRFTEADLAATAAAYDPAKHEAPIVVGHPAHNAPAYGWVQSISTSGDGLTAIPSQVDAAFSEMVGAGRFKKVSASFYTPTAAANPVPGVYYLRHVGFLGAQPPAVKGLKPVEFSEIEEGVVHFGELDDMTVASIFRRIREWPIGSQGKEVADQVIPGYEVDFLQQAAARGALDDSAPGDLPPAFSEPNPKENTVTPEEKTALEAENARLKQQIADVEAKRKSDLAAARHAEHLAFAETLTKEARIAAGHAPLFTAVLDALNTETPVQFGEAGSSTPLYSAFCDALKNLPPRVEFGEFATSGKAQAPEAANPLVADAESRTARLKGV